jgi:16S rRNA G527 N7-methylase RsmG
VGRYDLVVARALEDIHDCIEILGVTAHGAKLGTQVADMPSWAG